MKYAAIDFETAYWGPGSACSLGISLIGGFHLFNKTDEEILRLAEQIRETGIESVYTGHCTGDRAFALLKGKLGSMAEQLKVGLSIEF